MKNSNLTKYPLCFLLILQVMLMTPSTFAQTKGKENLAGSISAQPRRQLATIVFAGLGGAILGLSTLSFHGRPQDHLGDIAIGFAIGVIGGTIFTTYKAATSPYRGEEDYEVSSALDDTLFFEDRFVAQQSQEFTPKLAWQWSFE